MRPTTRFPVKSMAFVATLVVFGSARAADEKFVEKAAIAGMTEVSAGELAKTKGESAAVKQFGTQMVTDHTKAGDELKAIAGKKNMTFPAAPDDSHKKALAKLEGKSGKDFDKAYKSQMVSDHKDAVSLFEKEAKSGKDQELKAFAGKTLPDLKNHLDMAKALK